jgi:hypothetical protein
VREALRELIRAVMFPLMGSILSLASFTSVDPVRMYSNRCRRASRASIDESEETIKKGVALAGTTGFGS